MLHKKGSSFRRDCEGRVSAAEYRTAISTALAQDLGGAGSAAKVAIRWTGASERTAKNWMSGTYGPRAEHLIELMRHSDRILSVVLILAGRDAAMTPEHLKRVRIELTEILCRLDAVYGGDDDGRSG
ncbi:hypothetical protein [Halocynthiibacter namhaensis]|uniref:hypothetical protein n=1 Tax=Halocynthiibacter namhaensis TaxID=1290553 RepID=UPI0012E0C0F4|nr:hypothetical protein [Halocynthiibacter namhaensis]